MDMATIKTKLTYRSNKALVIKKGQDAAEQIGKRFGSYVRQTARQSIKKARVAKPTQSNPNPKRDVSKPGEAPRSVQGSLKAFILFAWDPATRTVVIGPKLLPGKRGDAPGILERGGTAPRKVRVFDRDRAGKGRGRRKAKIVTRTVSYEARPFMLPALEKRLPELPALWRNAIRG